MGLLDRLRGSRRADAPPPELWSAPLAGWVSVWLGDYTDELDIDHYLYEFQRIHRTQPHEDVGYEIRDRAVPLQALLAPRHGAEQWVPALVEIGAASGIAEASCAVIYRHYWHAEQSPPSRPLRFLGSVPMDGKSRG